MTISNALDSASKYIKSVCTAKRDDFETLSPAHKTTVVACSVLGGVLLVAGVAASIGLPIASIVGVVKYLTHASVSNLMFIGKIAAIWGYLFIRVTEAVFYCASAGGDIGGFLALGVAGFGYGALLLPVLILILPGLGVAAGGAGLMQVATNVGKEPEHQVAETE